MRPSLLEIKMHLLINTSLLIIALLLSACAGNTPSLDTRSESNCPAGQVLVCKGSSANSRVKDSRLNEIDMCICRQTDPF